MAIRFLDEQPQSAPTSKIRFLDEQPAASPEPTPNQPRTGKPLIPNPLDFVPAPSARNIGLGARYVAEGLAAPVTIGSDLLGALVNAYNRKQVITPVQSQFSDILTQAGLPTPQTTQEKLASDILSSAVAGGGIAKAGQKGIAALSGAIGGGTAGGVREAGGNIPAQIGAGLVAGGLSGAGLSKLATGPSVTPILKDATESGIENASALPNLVGSLQKEAKSREGRINRLFTQAKEKGQNAFIDSNAKSQLANDLRNQASNEIDLKVKEHFINTANQLDNFPSVISLNDIEGLRKSASRLARAPGSEGYAGGVIKSSIDNFISQPENISGDAKAANLWLKAIKERADYGAKFERPKAIAQALTDDANETIEQKFIGSGGAALNKNLSKVYKDVSNALPAKQKEIGQFQLRQSIINRMIKNSIQSVNGEDVVSVERLANQIRNFKIQNQSMWANFKPDEKMVLNDLQNNLYKLNQGGIINKVYTGVEKILTRSLRSNVQLPRTLKPKTVVSVPDLLELTTVKPKYPTIKASAVGAYASTKENK